MNLIYSSYTDVGGRANNEDFYCTENDNGRYLFIVADGLGGHDCGEIASETAVQIIVDDFYSSSQTNLVDSINTANDKILAMQNRTGKKMCTTIAAVSIDDSAATFVNIGDTRIYAFLHDKLVFQSVDHSVSQMAVNLGEISSSEIREHPDRNKLTQTLGSRQILKPSVKVMDNSLFDTVLICSDGFWEYIYESEMQEALTESKSPEEWLFNMRRYVTERATANMDNNTAVAVVKK